MCRANAGGPEVEDTMNDYYLVAAFLCWFYLVGSLIELPKA
jgi:hypothetical protein